jgi:hypothetical protein
MIGNRLELGLGYFGRHVVEKANGRMGSIVGGREPISWCAWHLFVLIAAESCSIFLSYWRNMVQSFVRWSLTTMEHAIRRLEYVWASAAAATMIWCDTSLVVLGESLIKGSRISFLQRCPKVFLPILQWHAAIEINDMHRLGVDALTVIVAMRPWGFVCVTPHVSNMQDYINHLFKKP